MPNQRSKRTKNQSDGLFVPHTAALEVSSDVVMTNEVNQPFFLPEAGVVIDSVDAQHAVKKLQAKRKKSKQESGDGK